MNKLLSVCLVANLISACSIFNTEPFADTHVDQSGQLLLSDTDKNWQFFRETMDRRIEAEDSGARPEGGKDTWNEYWLWIIDAQKTGRENGAKYINYIIEARREKGLPDLHDGI